MLLGSRCRLYALAATSHVSPTDCVAGYEHILCADVVRGGACVCVFDRYVLPREDRGFGVRIRLYDAHYAVSSAACLEYALFPGVTRSATYAYACLSYCFRSFVSRVFRVRLIAANPIVEFLEYVLPIMSANSMPHIVMWLVDVRPCAVYTFILFFPPLSCFPFIALLFFSSLPLAPPAAMQYASGWRLTARKLRRHGPSRSALISIPAAGAAHLTSSPSLLRAGQPAPSTAQRCWSVRESARRHRYFGRSRVSHAEGRRNVKLSRRCAGATASDGAAAADAQDACA